MSGMVNNITYYEQEVVYLECRHNHAASLGRDGYDGCHEFLQASSVDLNNTNNLLCAACGCHRNFHRKRIFYNPIICQTQNENHHVNRATSFAAGGGLMPMTVAMPMSSVPMRRRKRTKFTAEQRSRMMELAEKLRWRPQKSDKEEIHRFCLEVGISRRMFHVWLSNNRRRVLMVEEEAEANNNTTTTSN